MKDRQIKRICIVSNDYPETGHNRYTFVQQLAYGLTVEGIEVSVISPQSIIHGLIRERKLLKCESLDIAPNGRTIHIYRPVCVSFGTASSSASIFTTLQYISMQRAIHICLNKIGQVDCIYSYFWHMGLTVARELTEDEPLLIVQASEGEITVPEFLKKSKYLSRVNGVVCASGKNKIESINEKLLTNQKFTTVSNGYRTDEFYHIEKNKARKKLNIPEQQFVVIFVGSFIERKGIQQLCEALNKFDDIYSIFIGSGPIQPFCHNVIMSKSIPHKNLVEYLNCADLFVLPTRAEGCCNAIIEALACGLPIISSNKSFNDEILNDKCSIRINEQSVEEIYNAIKEIKSHSDLIEKMATASLEKAKLLTIEKRTNSILDFISNL